MLRETDEDTGMVTTFTVAPRSDGASADVSITTEGTTTRGGPLGRLERLGTVLFLRRTYRRELALLAALAEKK